MQPRFSQILKKTLVCARVCVVFVCVYVSLSVLHFCRNRCCSTNLKPFHPTELVAHLFSAHLFHPTELLYFFQPHSYFFHPTELLLLFSAHLFHPTELLYFFQPHPYFFHPTELLLLFSAHLFHPTELLYFFQPHPYFFHPTELLLLFSAHLFHPTELAAHLFLAAVNSPCVSYTKMLNTRWLLM